MPIITPDDVRVHYPQLVGTESNPELQALIAQADALLALYLGLPVPDAGGARTLEDSTYTVYPAAPHHSHPRRVSLGIRPVVSIASVHVDPDELYGSSTLLGSAEYSLDAQRGELWLTPQALHSWYVTGARANRVVLVAGYTAAPPDLRALVVAAVRHLWDRRRVQGLASQAAAGAAQTYSDAEALLPRAVRDALGPYVLWGSSVG